MKTSAVLSVLALALSSVPAWAQAVRPQVRPPAQTKSLSASERAFLKDALRRGKLAVELSKLALQNAQSEAVLQFAELQFEERAQANRALKSLAREYGLTLPSRLDDTGEKVRKELGALHGEAFDLAYMDRVITSDSEEVARLEKLNAGPAVRGYADATLPVLKEHLRLARNIHGVGEALKSTR